MDRHRINLPFLHLTLQLISLCKTPSDSGRPCPASVEAFLLFPIYALTGKTGKSISKPVCEQRNGLFLVFRKFNLHAGSCQAAALHSVSSGAIPF